MAHHVCLAAEEQKTPEEVCCEFNNLSHSDAFYLCRGASGQVTSSYNDETRGFLMQMH